MADRDARGVRSDRMTFDQLLSTLHGWIGEMVGVTLLPEDTTLRGRLCELDASGIDGALFGLSEGDGAPTGVALALFRDAVLDVRGDDDEVVVRQGHMVLRVARLVTG